MTELLRCTQTKAPDETDYPDMSGKKRKGRLPPAKPTKSSLIVACREEADQAEMTRRKSVEEFKLRKFSNVPPRISRRGSSAMGGSARRK